jgi:hypothetical protein
MCAIVARDQEAEDTSRSKVRSIQGFVAACLVLSVVFASLRFYVRLRILRSFRKDDWAVVATLVGIPRPASVASFADGKTPIDSPDLFRCHGYCRFSSWTW